MVDENDDDDDVVDVDDNDCHLSVCFFFVHGTLFSHFYCVNHQKPTKCVNFVLLPLIMAVIPYVLVSFAFSKVIKHLFVCVLCLISSFAVFRWHCSCCLGL